MVSCHVFQKVARKEICRYSKIIISCNAEARLVEIPQVRTMIWIISSILLHLGFPPVVSATFQSCKEICRCSKINPVSFAGETSIVSQSHNSPNGTVAIAQVCKTEFPSANLLPKIRKGYELTFTDIRNT